MTRHVRKESVLALLQGDLELFERLCENGFLPQNEHEFSPEHLETVRVAHSLLHELECNWAGVEVALHLRSELVATRRQVAELVALLRERSR